MTMLVKGGTIVDGTLAVPFKGDVLVDGDTIAGVFPGGAPAALETPVFDATGCIVSPGFVDCHSHSDAYLILEPSAPSKTTQGISTEVNGQCGGSAVPRYGQARLSSDWASMLGDMLTWRSFAEYRDVFDKVRPAINSVQFVGHNTLRSSVVGYAARAATEDELRRMEYLLAEAMESGAHGLTTGLIYQPGKYAAPGEVERLARAAARAGGIYATHMRSEGDRILEAIDEVAALARATGIKAEISHLKTAGRENWHKIDAVLEKVEKGVAEGIFLGSDRYPYCSAGTDLDVVLPDWAQEGAAKAECARLADAAVRRRIEDEIDASGRDWSSVAIGGTWAEENKRFRARTVAGILESGETVHAAPGALVCAILSADECRTGAFFSGMCEENLNKILSCGWVLPGSDASLRSPEGPLGADWPHPRAYGTMPEFYRALRSLGFSLAQAVNRMTFAAAARFGLARRGVVEKGAYADIAVWREESFKSHATYADPHRFSTGVELLLVNGAVACRSGLPVAGPGAGRLL